jgi:hypothetical protein
MRSAAGVVRYCFFFGAGLAGFFGVLQAIGFLLRAPM